MQDYPIAHHYIVVKAHLGVNNAIAAHSHVVAECGMGIYLCAVAYHNATTYIGKGAYIAVFANCGVGRNEGQGVDTRFLWFGCLVHL